MKRGACEELSHSLGVDTPTEVRQLFARNGTPLVVATDNGDYIRLRYLGQESDPGIAFVRGEGLCQLYMKAAGVD